VKVIIRNKKQYDEAVETLALYKKARAKILGGAQSYTIGAEQINRASLARIEESISAYEDAIDQYERTGKTGRRAGRIVPVD
jgi:hypothetical protein